MCPTLAVGSFFYSRKVHFFVHLFNNLNYRGSKHTNLRSAPKPKTKNKTRPEPRKHTKDPPLAPLFSALCDFCFDFFLFQCNVHQSRSKISKIRRIPKKCANQNGRPSRSLKSKRKHTQRKKTPPDHREDRKAAKEDIQKQKLANTPVLCHQNRKIARMSRKRDEEEGAIFA